ncbi:MAG TPA: enoyl-CoA hydratase/isomerase family protein [Nitrososphaerales archaeon]|nr:enoyl-CoA hydratase/isomerase family protein [Nitrososphaerales archaeon]
MPDDQIIYSVTSGVAVITINRPNALNALSIEAIHSLAKKLRDADNSPTVSLVVIRGAGDRAFCAGADIRIFDSFKDPNEGRNFWRKTGPEIHSYIEKMTKPVIAAVSGYCLGGGLEIALSCDLVIATDDSKFGFPEVNIGLIPGWGGTQRIARIVGRHKAKQFVMLGEMIGAGDAERLGIVNWVVKRENLDAFVNEVTSKLIQKSSLVLSRAKDAVNQAYDLTLNEGLSYETELSTSLLSTKDTKEGVRAFLEKRKPTFKSK